MAGPPRTEMSLGVLQEFAHPSVAHVRTTVASTRTDQRMSALPYRASLSEARTVNFCQLNQVLVYTQANHEPSVITEPLVPS